MISLLDADTGCTGAFAAPVVLGCGMLLDDRIGGFVGDWEK
jgi:hypothetical protein